MDASAAVAIGHARAGTLCRFVGAEEGQVSAVEAGVETAALKLKGMICILLVSATRCSRFLTLLFGQVWL